MTTRLYVVGIGLEGASGLSSSALEVISKTHVLVGGERLLKSFASYQGEKWTLGDFSLTLKKIKDYWQRQPEHSVCILATGDPLFFGFGRLVVNFFPADIVEFLPTVSSVQLAFSRLKLPWQDAMVLSVHGRNFDGIIEAVRKGCEKIAVLTDPHHSPAAIARMILALDVPIHYHAWVCENLGAEQERVERFALHALQDKTFASLTVLVLIREMNAGLDLTQLPIMGIPDACFRTFRDRPGLMTKREVRLLALGELALQPSHLCWDIGAGTGSMAIEMARLMTTGDVYAVEKTAAGVQLINQNIRQFGVSNVHVIQGTAPDSIRHWPRPDRVFIGGSGQQLPNILALCQQHLQPGGVIVLAIATLENFHQALAWFRQENWHVKILQVQLAKSLPIAQLTRLQPLNPVYLISAQPNALSQGL